MIRRSTLSIILLALAVAACGSPAENAVSRLIEQVRLGDPLAGGTYAADKELIDSAEVRPIWVEALLTDESAEVRKWAAQILGASGDAAVLPELVTAMSDERTVRDTAVEAIRSFPEDQAAAAFADALRSGNRDAQVASLGQLARLGSDSATSAVADTARIDDALVAKTATNTLGDIGSDAAAAALAQLAMDPAIGMDVRSAALSNLGRIQTPAGSDQLAAVIEALASQEEAAELLASAQRLQR